MVNRDTPETFLREAEIGVLSTVGPDGRPHAAPIWFLYEDGAIVMITGARSRKARNIARNPEVALTVDRRSLPYYAVMVRGVAEIGPRPADDLRLRMAVRYLGEDLGRRYHDAGTGEGTVTIRVQPRSIVEYRGRSGR